MAKTLKAPKSKLFLLHDLLGNFPKQKMEGESVKIANFFNAVKKPLRSFLDERAEIQGKADEKIRNDRKTLQLMNSNLEELKEERKGLKDNPEESVRINILIQEAKVKRDKFSESVNKKLEEENSKLFELTKGLEEEAEAVFDNEDFLFISKAFKENADHFFTGSVTKMEGTQVERLDINTMSEVFALLDSAQ